MEGAKYYVGLDVHKDTIAIAYAEASSREEPRFLGTTTHRGRRGHQGVVQTG